VSSPKSQRKSVRLDALPDVLVPRVVCDFLQCSSRRPDRILREKLAPAGLLVLKIGNGWDGVAAVEDGKATRISAEGGGNDGEMGGGDEEA